MSGARQPFTADPATSHSGRLTWYPDSLLPYSSLWHTCRRVVYLNALQPCELPTLLPRRKPSRSETESRALNVAPWIARNTTTLAGCLRVPEYQMLWASLNFLPAWVVSTISPRPRVCPSCLQLGYHSSFYSFSWLSTCPLHAHALVDHCLCGQALSYRLSAQDLASPSSCPCGRMRYFDARTGRRPAVTHQDTQALDEMAHWLQNLMMTVRLEHWGPLPAGLPRPSSPQSPLRQWSDAVGIHYPQVLDQVSACHPNPPSRGWAHVVTYQANPTLSRSGLNYHQLDRWRYAGWIPVGADLTRQDPVLVKAMARYLRRHVATCSRRWIHRLQASAYGPQMLTWMRRSKVTFWSYAYMLWCHVLGLDDATAWGGRDKEQDSGAYPRGSNSTNHVPERPYRTQADAWAQRHVVAQALLDLWWAVVEQARNCVRTGKLTWHLQIDFIEQSQHTQAVVDELNWGQLQLVMFTNRPLGVLGPEPRESGHAPEVGEGGGAKELSPMEERALHQAEAVAEIVGFWGRRG